MIGYDLDRAATILKNGELVAIPTETVYGLAANALNEEAVLKIYEAKNRPRFNPLILHVPSVEVIRKFTTEIPPLAEKLMQQFMPGPFSVLLPKKKSVPDLVTAGSPYAVFRIPDHPLTQQLLKSIDFPLAAPSANPSGYVSPTMAEHVQQQLGGKVSYILDGGECKVGIESTIVGFENGKVRMYRQGGVSEEDIAAVTGETPLPILNDGKSNSPGQLSMHYSTRTPLYLGDIEMLKHEYNEKACAILSFQKSYSGCLMNEVLSEKGDLHEAAHTLFAKMRRLDASGAGLILAEPVPDKGIGRAINDRLGRAAVK